MKGGIYTEEHCPICGLVMRDNRKDAVCCPDHSQVKASRLIVRFRGVNRRFASYDLASRFLNGLRYKDDEGSFDSRDYRKDNPLGFENQISRYLEIKKQTVKPGSVKNLKGYVFRAINYFGSKNIKEIGFAELQDFILAQEVSDKTKHNISSALHDFWSWLVDREEIAQADVPKFPSVAFKLKYRKIVSKDVQWKILEEVRKISFDLNPKIWLGIKWLCTYIAIRPGEMTTLKEKDIDPANGYIIFPDPKEPEGKTVPILEGDVEILKQFPAGLPDLPFFRHPKGLSGVAEGEAFGMRYFYKCWKKACSNLGIEGVDLYGGTKHSTARALRKYRSPEQIKKATMHKTNKAFDRYFDIPADDLREIYLDAAPGKDLEKDSDRPKTAKLYKLKE